MSPHEHDYRPYLIEVSGADGPALVWDHQPLTLELRHPWICMHCRSVVWFTHRRAEELGIVVVSRTSRRAMPVPHPSPEGEHSI